jgi:hypothetical protein
MVFCADDGDFGGWLPEGLFDNEVWNDNDVHFSRALPGRLDVFCFFEEIFFEEITMAEKKGSSKRSNGAAKQAAAKGVPKQASPKAKAPRIAEAPRTQSNPPAMSDEEIARKAYFLWESRGKPHGSAEEDWHKAKEELGA